MARKNILSGLIEDGSNTPNDSGEHSPPQSFRATATKNLGALGAVTRSIDELAARADAAKETERKLAAGKTVVDLDTALIDASFIADRVGMDEEEYHGLLEAFRQRGQDSPILVRPHPSRPGRYQVVFGHRRLRAASELGIPIRAVVRSLEDRDHVIAQGQENSHRADLAFIERALFAHQLEKANFGRDTVMAALGIDKTTASKMLSAIERIPEDILLAVREARGPGRDRWYSFAAAVGEPGMAERVRTLIGTEAFQVALPNSRFDLLESALKKDKKSTVPTAGSTPCTWQSSENSIRAKINDNGKRVTIALQPVANSDKATAFGAYLVEHLDRLFAAFEVEQRKHGE